MQMLMAQEACEACEAYERYLSLGSTLPTASRAKADQSKLKTNVCYLNLMERLSGPEVGIYLSLYVPSGITFGLPTYLVYLSDVFAIFQCVMAILYRMFIGRGSGWSRGRG